MPGGNGTGPMTGRAAGFCADNSVLGYANPVGGRGTFGCGRGFGGGGRGRRNRFYATGLPGWARTGYPDEFVAAPTTEQEQQTLKQQAQQLRNSLDAIDKRIEELEKNK